MAPQSHGPARSIQIFPLTTPHVPIFFRARAAGEHLPYHYSRFPRGHWNGELAITADLIRNAEGLRQAVIELRQLMATLRERGREEIGVLGTKKGGWIGEHL